MGTELRITSENDQEAFIEGYMVIFGGKDRAGQTFDGTTDFQPALVPTKPVLIEHTLDGFEQTVGEVQQEVVDDLGIRIKARVDKSFAVVRSYLDKLRQGKVGLSTGAVAHMVRRIKNVITRWPIVEVSLTTMPAEPRTLSLAQMKKFSPVLVKRLEAEQENRAESVTQPDPVSVSTVSNQGVHYMDNETVKSMADLLEEARKEGEAKAQAAHQAELKSLQDAKQAEEQKREREEAIKREAAREARMELEAELKSVRKPSPAFKATGDPDQDEINGYLHWMRTGDTSAVKTLLESDSTVPAMPTPLYNKIIQKASELSVMRLMGATVHKTPHKSLDVAYVTTNLTAAAAESEAAQIDAVQPVFDKVTIPLFKAAGYIPVSKEALADQYFDLEAELVNHIGRSIALRENAWFFAGVGTTEPYGIITRATQGATIASGQFSYQNLLDLMGSVAYEYTAGGKLAFAMNRDTLYGNLAGLQVSGHLVLQQLPVSGSGGVAGGRPGTWALNGIPVFDVSNIPASTPLAKVVYFGDFSQYHIVEKADGPEITRNPWEDMAHGIVRFYFETRLGGDLVQTDAVKYLKRGAV